MLLTVSVFDLPPNWEFAPLTGAFPPTFCATVSLFLPTRFVFRPVGALFWEIVSATKLGFQQAIDG